MVDRGFFLRLLTGFCLASLATICIWYGVRAIWRDAPDEVLYGLPFMNAVMLYFILGKARPLEKLLVSITFGLFSWLLALFGIYFWAMSNFRPMTILPRTSR
jgi:hypothetical protein